MNELTFKLFTNTMIGGILKPSSVMVQFLINDIPLFGNYILRLRSTNISSEIINDSYRELIGDEYDYAMSLNPKQGNTIDTFINQVKDLIFNGVLPQWIGTLIQLNLHLELYRFYKDKDENPIRDHVNFLNYHAADYRLCGKLDRLIYPITIRNSMTNKLETYISEPDMIDILELFEDQQDHIIVPNDIDLLIFESLGEKIYLDGYNLFIQELLKYQQFELEYILIGITQDNKIQLIKIYSEGYLDDDFDGTYCNISLLEYVEFIKKYNLKCMKVKKVEEILD